MSEQTRRSIAIIGAGPAGLVTARYALLYGLEPTVFEKTDSIGGVFRGAQANEPGLAWTSMMTNISDYLMRFMEFPPKPSAKNYPYRSQTETYEYLRDYARHFELEKHIFLKHSVLKAQCFQCEKSGRKKWLLKTNGDQVKEGVFDFLVVASGKCAKVNVLSFENRSEYRGSIIDCSQFSTLDLQQTFKDKKVLVLGGSISAADLTGIVARYASNVTHLLRRYSYWIRKMLPSDVLQPENSVNVRPWELVLFSRRYRTDIAEIKFPTAQDIQQGHEILGRICKDVAAHPAYRSCVIDKSAPAIAWPSVFYSPALLDDPDTKDKIHPIVGDTVDRLTTDGVLLRSGKEVKADVILLCTGYKANFDFFDKEILETLEYDPDELFQEIITYKLVFRPELPTLAFVGILTNDIWQFLELHARWAVMTFCDIIPMPSEEKMRATLEEERKLRAMRPRKGHAHDDFVGYSDSLALEIGVLPDFEKLKVEDPDLYNKLWNGPVIPEHYALFGPGSERTAANAKKAIDEAWQYMTKVD